MFSTRIFLSAYGWLSVVALLLFSTTTAESKTAVLFGATGAVGNEVLRAILRNNSFFTKLIIVGRNFPPKVTDVLPEPTSSQLPEVVRVELPDLRNVDQNEELLAMDAADACFIATGSAYPYLFDLANVHFVEVDMVASMTRLCDKLKVRSVTAFSAVDPAEIPNPYTREELEYGSDGTPMGWWCMMDLPNIMRLKEVAVTDNAGTIPYVRIFQPSNIITEEIRYGWLDWTIFKIHPWLDPWIPTKYHSVNVALLGMAMVRDAIRLLSGTTGDDNESREEHGATQLTYGDFLRIGGTDFAEWEEEQRILKEEKNTEL